jgi:hypothetical protein
MHTAEGDKVEVADRRPAMTRTRAAWLLWASTWLLLPLPYHIIADGRVPVVRIAILSAVSLAYACVVDGSGVAWVLAFILLCHVVLYSILLAVAAAAISFMIPANARRSAVWALIFVGFATVLLFNVYRTPFDATSIHSNWIGLFQ